MKSPLTISLVIPVFNEEDTIERCLDAIAAQTVPPSQVVIVDNNCTDATIRLVKNHGNYEIVRQYTQGIGIAAATGYDAATSDIIVRCDADSVAPVDWIERIHRQFSTNTQLDALTGPGEFYDTNRLQAMLAKYLYMEAYFYLVGLALTQPPLFGSNFAMRGATWRAVRSHIHADKNDIHDDIDLSYHLIGRSVMYDRSLVIGISARPLKSFSGMMLRYRRGVQSIVLHKDSYSFVSLYRRKLATVLKR